MKRKTLHTKPSCAHYLANELQLLQKKISALIDEAETLLGTLDECDRLISNAEWRARRRGEKFK